MILIRKDGLFLIWKLLCQVLRNSRGGNQLVTPPHFGHVSQQVQEFTLQFDSIQIRPSAARG